MPIENWDLLLFFVVDLNWNYKKKFHWHRWSSSLTGLRTLDPPLGPPSTTAEFLDKDPNDKTYMTRPPRVSYSRTSSLREPRFLNKVPAELEDRSTQHGLQEMWQQIWLCHVPSLCEHQQPHLQPHWGELPHQHSLSCTTPGVIYCITCTKDSGQCVQLGGPQYIGCTGRKVKTRFSEHVGSVTEPGQSNTNKSVGVHFRSAGHSYSDMRILPIEKVRSSDPFVLEARERYWINKYESLKNQAVDVVEHGLNIKG